MSFTANTGEFKVTRTDTFLVDPRALVIDWTKNLSRGGVEPAVDDELIRLAREMAPKQGAGDSADGSSGQLNPIVVRPLPDRRLEVIGGFRRTRAALHLIESGICPDFKIKYTVSRLSDAEAALVNLCENIHREDPKPIQLAHAIRSLTEDYGLDLDTVAARLKMSKSWCEKLLELVMLPSVVQASVAAGETPVTAAMELTKLPTKEQAKVFNAAKASGEKLTAAKIKGVRRATQAKTGGGPVPRTISDLKSFLEARGGPFAANFLEYLAGKTGDEAFGKVWDQMVSE